MWNSIIFSFEGPDAGRLASSAVRVEGMRVVVVALDPRVHPYHGRRQVEEGILWYAQAVNHQAGDG
ncbi:hypothetical protein PG991_004819 [Apiospora marii]|uniref:Uncharacterized protein n=1 Tax=Apiospora marii TaxID=335849 RepID=A0ABR1S8T5_9PEZI